MEMQHSRTLADRVSDVEDWQIEHDATCTARYGEIVKGQDEAKRDRSELRELISAKMASIYRLIWGLVIGVGSSIIVGLVGIVFYLVDRFVVPPGH